ncbi:MAG: hypothetical protein QF473_23270, partial [Planctomycetota bacterium]|nr:hypothetical protein [Planctomycetota bacterium]
MSTKSKISTRLRIFIIVSIVLHVIVGVSTVVPYLVKRHLEEQRLRLEQEARELARKKAEMELQKATREVAREKVVDALKTDAYDLLSENLEMEEFEEFWDDLLEEMEI